MTIDELKEYTKWNNWFIGEDGIPTIRYSLPDKDKIANLTAITKVEGPDGNPLPGNVRYHIDKSDRPDDYQVFTMSDGKPNNVGDIAGWITCTRNRGSGLGITLRSYDHGTQSLLPGPGFYKIELHNLLNLDESPAEFDMFKSVKLSNFSTRSLVLSRCRDIPINEIKTITIGNGVCTGAIENGKFIGDGVQETLRARSIAFEFNDAGFNRDSHSQISKIIMKDPRIYFDGDGNAVTVQVEEIEGVYRKHGSSSTKKFDTDDSSFKDTILSEVANNSINLWKSGPFCENLVTLFFESMMKDD